MLFNYFKEPASGLLFTPGFQMPNKRLIKIDKLTSVVIGCLLSYKGPGTRLYLARTHINHS